MIALDKLAPLVEYPGPALWRAIEECGALVPGEFRTAARDPGALEQTYTDAFDLRPERSLYVGHHLFGEDLRRSLFMARLKGRCAELGVDCGVELPDHLAVVLRLLAAEGPGADTDELIVECTIPAVKRMLAAAPPPYDGVLSAILTALEEKGGAAWTTSSSSPSPISR